MMSQAISALTATAASNGEPMATIPKIISKTPQTMDQYLQTYVLGVRDHWEYLEKVGGARRMNEIECEPRLPGSGRSADQCRSRADQNGRGVDGR